MRAEMRRPLQGYRKITLRLKVRTECKQRKQQINATLFYSQKAYLIGISCNRSRFRQRKRRSLLQHTF